MHDHDFALRTHGVLYTAMAVAMSAGLDHMAIAGFYLILGLSSFSLSGK